VIYALTPEATRRIAGQFQLKSVQKSYLTVLRGWLPSALLLDHPLKNAQGEPQESQTHFDPLAHVELPHAVGRYTTARYTLVLAKPITGRTHQIRRHANHLAHPIVGDTLHGDRKQNAFFKSELKLPGLLLKAARIEFDHPTTQEKVVIRAKWDHKWHEIFKMFGVCSYLSPIG
jgi:tRNA pseudouridine65 synthase